MEQYFPGGIHRCEVSGSDRQSQHHHQVIYTESGAPRFLYRNPCGCVPRPHGCGGWWGPLVGHLIGCTGWNPGVGSARSSYVEVWFLSSEQPRPAICHQLSPGPSGCAALGRRPRGPRHCGVGFFKRKRYPEATVPQYHAVKIPREDRQLFKEEKTGTILRNNWGTPRRESTDGHPILGPDGHSELGTA
uniref:Uncharacterized protein n=1 Tax=Monodelphis domestica TaxID=13616 RepID=H9H5Y0_MONDO